MKTFETTEALPEYPNCAIDGDVLDALPYLVTVLLNEDSDMPFTFKQRIRCAQQLAVTCVSLLEKRDDFWWCEDSNNIVLWLQAEARAEATLQ